MTPDRLSRYAKTNVLLIEATGVTLLAGRSIQPFRTEPDNLLHRVTGGETLHQIAETAYGFPGAANLWWLIADYQDPPILDPTVQLEGGALLVIPPLRLLNLPVSPETLE